MTTTTSDAFARKWVQAWNRRDLEALLLRYADDVEFGSPLAAKLLGEASGTVHLTIRYVSPRGWIRKTDYLQQSFRDSLRAFSRRRATLLETLSRLDAVGWSRRATFTATTRAHAAVTRARPSALARQVLTA